LGEIMRALFVLCAFLSILPSVQANVSLRTGNFFIGYRDVVYTGGFEPKIERVYNSKSIYKGMFGWGWGTEYEVYLRVSADGSITVYEYGGGAENRFTPVKFNAADFEQGIKAIVDAARSSGKVSGAARIEEYQKQLREDPVLRNREWEALVRSGKLQRRKVPEGTQFTSNKFSYQYITRLKSGYQRSFENGKVEVFDEDGKLVKITDRNNNFLNFTYQKDGKLRSLEDNFLRKMFLSWNNKGLLEKVESEGGKTATYQYNDQLELTQVKDAFGNVYRYEYSTDNYHNLRKITYSDKTTMEIEYYGVAQDLNVKSLKDREGTLTEYSYQKDKADDLHFTVGVKVKNRDSRPISNSSYEYFLKRKPNGESWQYRLVTVVDGDRTETTYNECCGLPTLIKKGSDETKFKYDVKGRVVEKDTPSELTRLAYHPQYGKVTKVDRFSKLDRKRAWFQYSYDSKGNLALAKNDKGKGVQLIYDRNGRIASMIDESKRRIDFKYDQNSKPIEIIDPKLGSIKVTYSNSGEVKSVDSSAGRRIALQVTSAFQNLLDIIRPAGVTLSF
jgi:YD repeat-containing protein